MVINGFGSCFWNDGITACFDSRQDQLLLVDSNGIVEDIILCGIVFWRGQECSSTHVDYQVSDLSIPAWVTRIDQDEPELFS
jgi:hypothetical protein